MKTSSTRREAATAAEIIMDKQGKEVQQITTDDHVKEGGGRGEGRGGRGRGHFNSQGNQAGRGGNHSQEVAGSQDNPPKATTTALIVRNNNKQQNTNGETDKASTSLQQTGVKNDATGKVVRQNTDYTCCSSP